MMLHYVRRHSAQPRRRLDESLESPTTTTTTTTPSDYIHLANLMDFDVQIARVSDALGDSQTLFFNVSDVVTEWMNDSFHAQLQALGYRRSDSERDRNNNNDNNNNRNNRPGENEDDDEADDDAALRRFLVEAEGEGDGYAQFDSVILLQRSPAVVVTTTRDGSNRRGLRSDAGTKDPPASLTQHMGSPSWYASWLRSPAHHHHRRLQTMDPGNSGTGTNAALLTAQFKGAALFTKNNTQIPVPAEVVQYIQQETMRNQTGLLILLQQSLSMGLGRDVVDVSAFVVASSDNPNNNNNESTNNQLTLIIYIAVAVAVLAFLFLLLAVLWAWRHDRRNRDAYLRRKRQEPSTSAESAPSAPPILGLEPPPVSEIGGYGQQRRVGLADASVASDDLDVSTALSQYYRQGSGTQGHTSGMVPVRRSGGLHTPPQFNDAASVSSMESYGYSLDGYASTIAGTNTFGLGEIPNSSSYGLDMDSMVRADDDDDDDDDETDDDDLVRAGPRDL